MGGIPTDADGQVIADADGTPLTGFYAAGEVACVSVHGANRLGTNSLLEASVFGRRAGYAIAAFVKEGAKLYPVSGDPAERNRQRVKKLMDNPGTENVEHIAQALKTTMTNNCGVFRDGERLSQAMTDIKALQARFKNAQVMDKSSRFNTDLLATIETDHLLTFSEVIVAGALARRREPGRPFSHRLPRAGRCPMAEAHRGPQRRCGWPQTELQVGQHRLGEVPAPGAKILMSRSVECRRSVVSSVSSSAL